MTDTLHLDRLPAVLEQRGDGRSSLYLDIQRGIWTRPVRLGRSSAWPRHEVQALVCARIAAATADQLRKLVQDLHQRRLAMMPSLGVTQADTADHDDYSGSTTKRGAV